MLSTDPSTSASRVENASRRLVRRIVKQWPLVLFCALIAGGAGYYASSSQTKQYEATTTMQLNEVDLPSLFLAQNLQQQGQDATAKTATNADLVTMPSVLERAAMSLGGGITASHLSSAITVSAKSGTTLLEITARDPDRSRAAAEADGVRLAFIKTRTIAGASKFSKARNRVQEQFDALGAAERRSASGKLLSDRLQQIDTLMAVSDGGVDTVQTARATKGPVSPTPKRDAVLALIAGALIGLGAATLRARLDDRIRDVDELAELWNLPALGLIPESSSLKASSGAHLPSGAALEAFGLARTNLRYLHVGGDIQTLLVTSASEGEGKSTVALNLCVAAALADVKVLLVEADLRRPVLSSRLAVATRHGLSEVLVGIGTFDEAIATVEFGDASVDVLPAGLVPPSPSALFERAGMPSVLTAAREKYDLVVVDTPPATVVGDAKALSAYVDGIVVVSRLGRLKRSSFERLRDLLSDLNTPVLGTIVNGGASSKAYGYAAYSGSPDAGAAKPPSSSTPVPASQGSGAH